MSDRDYANTLTASLRPKVVFLVLGMFLGMRRWGVSCHCRWCCLILLTKAIVRLAASRNGTTHLTTATRLPPSSRKGLAPHRNKGVKHCSFDVDKRVPCSCRAAPCFGATSSPATALTPEPLQLRRLMANRATELRWSRRRCMNACLWTSSS